MLPDEAIDDALAWVNNVSKRKLLGSLAEVKSALFAMDAVPAPPAETAGTDAPCPLVGELLQGMQAAMRLSPALFGTYMSYSASSGSTAMKAEPYLLLPSADASYVEVVHNSVYGTTHHGVAVANGLNHLYIMFNENRSPQLALYSICLKLPMFDNPPFLRGFYTCFDYNYNPIARRILLVKLSAGTSRDEFMDIAGALRPVASLDERERAYYDYTCGRGDVIRMGDIPSPTMSDDDLAAEKELLAH